MNQEFGDRSTMPQKWGVRVPLTDLQASEILSESGNRSTMPQQWGVRVRVADLHTVFMSSCLAYVGLGGGCDGLRM